MDGKTALTASSHATRSVDDGGTSTDYLDAASAVDSDDESTSFSDHPLDVLNPTSSATEADSCEPAGSESSSEDGCFERGSRAQPFVAHRLSESLVKVLKLEHVQNKIRQDLRMRGACFKFDKADKTTFLVKQGMKARLDKVLSQKIRTEQFDIHDEDHVELGIVSSLNTKELQNEMVMDYDGKRLTLIYHVTTGSKISESLNGLRTPLREINLSLAVGRFLEVENNLQRFIATFHRNAAFQVYMEVNKDHQNRSILCVRSNRPHTQAAVSRVKEHIAGIEQRELSISLAKGLYLLSLRGQREVDAIAQQHHCVIRVHTGPQHVLLKASHREDVLLVCEGSLACCCPQVFILPLCEGQAQWNPHYQSIMERGLLSCNTRKHASLIGPPPKPWVHTITSSCGKERRSIIVMYVPTAANEVDFQRQLKDSCRAAMQAALEVCPEGEVVLPVSLEDSPTSECTALPMLMAVREAVRDSARTTLHLKLFFETTHPDLPETVVRMEKRLFGCGWSLDRYYGERDKPEGSSFRDYGDVQSATVHLVGLKKDIANAINKVNATDTPSEYEAIAEEFKTSQSQLVANASNLTTGRTPTPEPGQHSGQAVAIPANPGLASSEGGPGHQDLRLTSAPSAAAVADLVSQPQRKRVFTRVLDSATVQALRILMKADFARLTVEQMEEERVTVQCGGPSAQDVVEKMDSLTLKEVQLGHDDLQKLPAPWDTTEEGVAACLVPVPQQGKVIIFSFDHNALPDATHLLNVKLGRVRSVPEPENARDTAGDGPSSRPSLPSPGQSSPTVERAEFTTKSGIKVSVYSSDITKLSVDAIVNNVNEILVHGGIVSRAIATAAGPEMVKETMEFVRRHGPLRVREVVETTAGLLPCKKVLHAVGPHWLDDEDEELSQQPLADTVYNCLLKADTLKLTSLALTAIGSGLGGFSKEMCGKSCLSAIQTFDRECGKKSSLRHIHLVDLQEHGISILQEIFGQSLEKYVGPKKPTFRRLLGKNR